MNTPRVKEITKAGMPYVQMPKMDYVALRQRLDDLEDIQAIGHARQQYEAGAEFLPLAITERMVQGEHPLKVLREYRRFTQARLSQISGVNRAYISEIETGRKQGSVAALKALAAALRVSLDDLV